MLEPPHAEIGEHAGQVFRPRRKAVPGAQQEAATTASLDLELVGERLRLGLGARLGGFATSIAGRVSPLGVLDATALEDTRHDLRASVALT